MLLRKLWRTMGTYKAQFISMIIMIALGIGIFIGFNIEWYSLEKNSDSFLRETNFADYRIVSESGFSADDVQNVLSVDGVKASSRFISVNADVKERDGDSVALTVTENPDVSSFITVDGDGYDPDLDFEEIRRCKRHCRRRYTHVRLQKRGDHRKGPRTYKSR